MSLRLPKKVHFPLAFDIWFRVVDGLTVDGQPDEGYYDPPAQTVALDADLTNKRTAELVGHELLHAGVSWLCWAYNERPRDKRVVLRREVALPFGFKVPIVRVENLKDSYWSSEERKIYVPAQLAGHRLIESFVGEFVDCLVDYDLWVTDEYIPKRRWK